MNNFDTTLTGDNAVVSDVVREYVPKCGTHGLAFRGVTLDRAASRHEPYPSFHFSNPKNGIRMDVSFAPATQDLNGRFVVRIRKPTNQTLNVSEYLKAHGREELTKYFTYHDPATDVRRFAEDFVQMLIKLMETDLKPVLEGRVFEETPIDWMGYK